MIKYRYSLLRQEQPASDDYESALAVHTSLYEDSSDEVGTIMLGLRSQKYLILRFDLYQIHCQSHCDN